jgi:uncharacterized membrane protein (UPF0127 family)
VLELLLILAAATATPTPAPPACIAPDGTRVRVDLAIDDQERVLGLMFRDSLPPDQGMLFIFPQDDRYPFWMKNTFIALDLVWLDQGGRVVEVKTDVQPCRTDPCPSYTPSVKGRAVLEVNAGFAKKHGIAAGATLRCENVPGFPLKGQAK